MLGADGVSPRFERWAAETAPGLAARRAGIGLLVAASYLLVTARLGLRGPSHWLLATVAVALPVTIPVVRRLLLSALPFIILAAVYDWLGLARSFVAARGVHVLGPYLFERALFGVGSGADRLTLNELFARHHWAAVDLVAGCAYLSYVFAVAGFAIFLALADRTHAGVARTRALGWTFLGVNVVSFVIYLLWPVAPPWYVATHGLGPVAVDAAASPAALVRWDALVGVPYFANFYAQSSDVFGSMPSMHCAYPALLVAYGRELGRIRLLVALVCFQLIMCFSAVYLQHHYLTDVLAGLLCALLGYIVERGLSRRPALAPAAPENRP
ncbi:MAG TPA: phosphatase PAP2 family protein [Polyangia bacterium]|nr:phosphatase PAP2 family protein [Polyangia bacterium]